MRYLVGAWALAACVAQASVVPQDAALQAGNADGALDANVTSCGSSDPDEWSKRSPGDVELRIMSLGASIMSGFGSSGNGGVRRYLRAALEHDGWKVNMVGNRKSGDMNDNDHEARGGDVISQVHDRLKKATFWKPNVVLINAGFNDASKPIDTEAAGDRMGLMLDDIWGAPDMDSTCVFLSTLLPTEKTPARENVKIINRQYRDLVDDRAGEGRCIYRVETEKGPGGKEIFTFENPDLYCSDYFGCDKIHPNNEGHKLLASIFRQAIQAADRDKKIKKPAKLENVNQPSSACDKHAGNGHGAGGLTQRGSGADDGIYLHDSKEMPVTFEVDSEWDRDQWHFARLYTQGHDDLLASLDRNEDGNVERMVVWSNSADGNAKFTRASQELQPGIECPEEGVRFLDMNADGLDDLVCLFSDGHMEIAINQQDGNRPAGRPPTFKAIPGSHRPAGLASRSRVMLGDIDGDGRGDYGLVLENGEHMWWRNDGGVQDEPRNWERLGVRSPGGLRGDAAGYRLEDINGDGRDDLMYVTAEGKVTTWTNSRSCKKGVEGDGLNVAWRRGYYNGKTSGPTHIGVPWAVNDEEKSVRGRIHFARIYGETPVTGNLAKQDYVFMQHEKKESGDKRHHFTMRVWKNTGHGGSKLQADGNKYCNVMGHRNGAVDYVWTWGGGAMQLWASRGKKTITNNDKDGWWEYKGYMWDPPREMARRDLHLADWDGDGRCDILHVDPSDGTVEVFINQGKGDDLPSFTSIGKPASQLRCKYRNGLGIRDIAVRFADLTGNGRADYLCMAPDAETTGFIQEDNGAFTDVGQIKLAANYDRADYQWTDVNGDGKADLLWVEKFSGDGYVWYNEKRGKPGEFAGSAFYWRRQSPLGGPRDVAYAGQVAGTCEYFVDLDGNGRADIHSILGTFTNKAKTSLAPDCSRHDTIGDPEVYVPLPEPPNFDVDGPGNG